MRIPTGEFLASDRQPIARILQRLSGIDFVLPASRQDRMEKTTDEATQISIWIFNQEEQHARR